MRVYAKLIGPILPKSDQKIGDCTIKKMTLTEQRKRKFTVIEAIEDKPKPEPFYKSYIATRRLSLDKRDIKTQYVIYCDFNTNDWQTAVNRAYQVFDEVIGTLNVISTSEKKIGDKIFPYFVSYDYQIAKVYNIIDTKEEVIDIKKFSSEAYLKINSPLSTFEDVGVDIDIINKHYEVSNNFPNLKLASEYLVYAERSMTFRMSLDNVILNLVKSVEAILNSFLFSKKKKSFQSKLRALNHMFKLDDEEIDKIMKLWKTRSNFDIAHASTNYIKAQYYITELPINKAKMITVTNENKIVAKMIKKYSEYLMSLVIVKVKKYHNKAHRIPELVYVTNRGYYWYDSNQIESIKLTNELKRRISSDLSVSYKNIRKVSCKNKKYIFQVNNERFSNETKRQMYVVFGN